MTTDAAGPDQQGFQCQHCDRMFHTFSGHRQHEKPKIQYNAELERESKGARKHWSDAEVRDLTDMEAKYRFRLDRLLGSKLVEIQGLD